MAGTGRPAQQAAAQRQQQAAAAQEQLRQMQMQAQVDAQVADALAGAVGTTSQPAHPRPGRRSTSCTPS